MRQPDPQKFDPDPADLEEYIRRMDKRRLIFAFTGAILLHSSFAVAFVSLSPEPVDPPGELMVTIDLAPAVASSADTPLASESKESVMQREAPPVPVPQPEDKIVEDQKPLPAPDIAKEQIAEPPPPAEKAEVVIAPKKEQERKKPEPQPATPQQMASSTKTLRADVGGSGASASPSEIAEYIGRVRAAIERKKRYPASAGGAEGEARIGFTVTKSGAVTGVRLTRSSGNAALDAAARNAVASADIPPIPEGMPGSMNLGTALNFIVR